jgi:L-iditol 2-dehydrogenase
VAQGRIRIREIVTHRFALRDYGKAIATFKDRSSGCIKIVLTPD